MGIEKTGSKPITQPKPATVAAPPPKAAVAKPPPAKAPESSFKPTQKQAKERAAQMKQLEGTLKFAEVPADVQTKLMDKMKKLPPAEFDREVAQIMKHVEGPNADRAISTQAKLLEMADASPAAKARLTPEVRGALVDSVGTPRDMSRLGSADALGQAGIMGQQQAEQAAKGLIAMPAEQYKATTDLLAKAGQSTSASPAADPQTEKSLILKAVASRADRLGANLQDNAAVSNGQANATESARAMKEISDFAVDIRGSNKSELIKSTSPLDLDPTRNSSTLDPNKMNSPTSDMQGDNDGLYQRYLQSCGPTVAQMAHAEADPVYARALSKDPSLADKDQAAMLTAAGAQGPRHRESRQLWDNAAEGAKKMGLDTDEKFGPLRKTIAGEDQGFWDSMTGKTQLKQLQLSNGGHPTDAEMKKMRADGADGKKQMDLDVALNTAAKPSTHVDYTNKKVAVGGLNDDDLKTADTNLKRGQAVPLRMDIPGEKGTGHFVNVTDVRGNSPNRRYLVSDPWSGKTGWVKEGELKNDPGQQGQWQKRIFGLDATRVTDLYVKKD
jgi:hypothetical protein